MSASTWTNEDIQKALAGLAVIRDHGFSLGSPIPPAVFYAWLGAFYGVAIEVVITSNLAPSMVYLIQRPKDDPFYAGLWHTSGSILFPKEGMDEAARRVVGNEIGLKIGMNGVDPSRIKFVGRYDNVNNPRGHEPQMVYHLELTSYEASNLGNREEKQWFPMHSLPHLVPSHNILLGMVLGSMQK